MMTPELTALVAALFVQIGTICLAQGQMNRELGPKLNASPRDRMPEFSALLGRLRRAVDNGFEGLGLFAPAVLIVAVSAQSTAITAAAAWIYVAARVLYIPAYAFGWSPWRSVIWTVVVAATVTLLGAALI